MGCDVTRYNKLKEALDRFPLEFKERAKEIYDGVYLLEAENGVDVLMVETWDGVQYWFYRYRPIEKRFARCELIDAFFALPDKEGGN